jgi:hypothetical protein
VNKIEKTNLAIKFKKAEKRKEWIILLVDEKKILGIKSYKKKPRIFDYNIGICIDKLSDCYKI